MKIHPGEAEVFHADRCVAGQTDGHDEANSHFSQFCECAKERTVASITRWNSIKCLHPRETYIQKTWYSLIRVVLSNALFDNEICFYDF
jgi:hypothetical protein